MRNGFWRGRGIKRRASGEQSRVKRKALWLADGDFFEVGMRRMEQEVDDFL
jgi:hypothetical protein